MYKTLARTAQIVIDLLALSLAFWLAFALRFDWDIPAPMLRRALLAWPALVALQYALLVAKGVHRIAWRYVSLRDAALILYATTLAAAACLVLRFVVVALGTWWPAAHYLVLPAGVNAIDLVLSFVGLTGVRAMRRLMTEHAEVALTQRGAKGRVRIPTLLVGAGRGGVMVAKEIAARPDLGILPVGFIDDDPLKLGVKIQGVPVVGTTATLAACAARLGAQQALITISDAPGPALRAIADLCRTAGLRAKLLPGLHEIVGGRVNLSRIREVAIEDLLGREPVQLDLVAIADVIRDRTAMVTGAGGSIGSELCRQLAQFQPDRLVLVEKSENALFAIHQELADTDFDFNVVPCVADVGDETRMRTLFEAHRPHVVFHAAAHKHVPMMERDAGEAVKNNVFGTKLMADLASEYRAHAFVMISTDKAVNPTSVMGATKRVAEIYTQALSSRSATRFVTVRFGNVLGSNGSVIPIFKQQIAAGGPIRVTHPEMKRYFMTIPEACQLVLQAGSMGRGGEIFVLDMGEPVKIVDLARDLIRLSGFTDDEIKIVFVGTRPGEKLFEELSLDEEKVERTRHPKVYAGRTRCWAWNDVERALSCLQEVVNATESATVRDALRSVVSEYSPAASSIPPTSSPMIVSEPGTEPSPDNSRLTPAVTG